MNWSRLSPWAKAYRIAHGAWSVLGLTTLGYIWWCAITGRRDRRLAGSIGFLAIEGVALVVGRGDCPLGPFQARLGDPVPLFELVLPPRAAKAAVPVLAVVTIAGIGVVAARALQDVQAVLRRASQRVNARGPEPPHLPPHSHG